LEQESFLEEGTALSAFAHRLERIPDVKRFDRNGDLEAWRLATAFAELEQVSRRFLEVGLRRLVDPQTEAKEVNELLLAFGEDLRHLLTHFAESRFFHYVFAERFPEAPLD